MRFPWRATLGFALSAALMYFVLRGQSWSTFAAALRASNAVLWILAVVVSQLIFPLRVLRWRPILHSVAPDVRFAPLWRSTTIGMMVNNVVIPSRLGELARAYALAREEPRVPFATGLASLVVDRSFDAVIVLALILVALVDPHFSAHVAVKGDRTLGTTIVLMAAAVTVLFAILFMGVARPQRFEALATWFARKLAVRHESRVRDMARNFTSGLGVLRDPGRFAAVFLWTVVHWLTNAAAVWISFRAMHLEVPLTAALLVQGLIVLGAAAPQMPAYFGAFEFAAGIALGAYGIAHTDAVAWALTYHVLTLIPITLVGGWYFVKVGLSVREFRQPPAAPHTA